MSKPKSYDCAKCPGYCCSYPLIEVTQADIARLGARFNLDLQTAEKRFTKYDKGEKVRALRHRKDEHYGTACRFLDAKTRRCTVYEDRPAACRSYPYGKSCGYYAFLTFERKHQDDNTWVARTNS